MKFPAPKPIPFVKICGITRDEDAALALKLQASALGFVFFSQSKRAVSYDQVAKIRADHAPFLGVGVFVNPTLNEVIQAVKIAKINAIQLHGDESQTFVSSVRAEFPDLTLIKGLRLGQNAITPDFEVDYLLLDHRGPEWGGSGKTIDWEAARLFIDRSEKPVLLAGGLNAKNIQHALDITQAFGADLSSSIETSPGLKSEEKMRNLFQVFS